MIKTTTIRKNQDLRIPWKINGINSKEKQALIEYKKILFQDLPNQISQLVLFGSKARGDAHKDSDLDLLVVTNWSEKNKQAWKKIIQRTADILLKFDDVLISPKVKTQKEFIHSSSPLIQNIKKEGVELWNQRQKNNLLDRW